MKRPDVLIFMSDEHRFDVNGFYGNKVIRTPNLDELSENAVVFDNAYTPAPVCIPARQCIASGCYPRTCKVERFGEDLAPFYPTFARMFSEQGYQTVACGKLHHLGPDQMQGWMRRVAADARVDVSFYERMSGKKDAAYQFDGSVKWNDKKEILRAGPGHPVHARNDELTLQGCKNFIYEYFVDSFYDRASRDKPLLLYVGMERPHYPYIAGEELFNYYLNRVEPYKNITPSPHPFLGRCSNTPPLKAGEDITPREVKRAMAAYYANVETVDAQFGEIIGCLADAGENIDDWIIVFASDHGEMLGEHSIWEKQRFYEGSARVPLFIRFPRGFGPGRCPANVSLIDLYPTLCELCKVKCPGEVEGRSLTGLLTGERYDWTDETASEYGGINLMIKKGHLKYQFYSEDSSEILFDLERDPQENHNFASDVRYKLEMEYFRERKICYGYDSV